jgi:hypothetical protein
MCTPSAAFQKITDRHEVLKKFLCKKELAAS